MIDFMKELSRMAWIANQSGKLTGPGTQCLLGGVSMRAREVATHCAQMFKCLSIRQNSLGQFMNFKGGPTPKYSQDQETDDDLSLDDDQIPEKYAADKTRLTSWTSRCHSR